MRRWTVAASWLHRALARAQLELAAQHSRSPGFWAGCLSLSALHLPACLRHLGKLLGPRGPLGGGWSTSDLTYFCILSRFTNLRAVLSLRGNYEDATLHTRFMKNRDTGNFLHHPPARADFSAKLAQKTSASPRRAREARGRNAAAVFGSLRPDAGGAGGSRLSAANPLECADAARGTATLLKRAHSGASLVRTAVVDARSRKLAVKSRRLRRREVLYDHPGEIDAGAPSIKFDFRGVHRFSQTTGWGSF